MFQSYLGLAMAASARGQKQQARKFAEQASEIDPAANEPYNLLGNLYFHSFDDCKKSVSRTEDRAVYILAYMMYEKAGNTLQMQSCQDQFPSVEEIFNEGYEKGQSIPIGCWINLEVELATRD